MAKTIKFTVTLSSETERAFNNAGFDTDDAIKDEMIDLMADVLADYREEHGDDLPDDDPNHGEDVDETV